jgi:hypothetical protein
MNALWPSSSAVGIVDAATVRLLTFRPFEAPHLPPMPPSLGERA